MVQLNIITVNGKKGIDTNNDSELQDAEILDDQEIAELEPIMTGSVLDLDDAEHADLLILADVFGIEVEGKDDEEIRDEIEGAAPSADDEEEEEEEGNGNGNGNGQGGGGGCN